MPRFVVLTHDHPELHWDFMLEAGDTLRTWRLTAPPTLLRVEATRLPAHRQVYLDYEGPVTGDRGTVSRWDAGVFEWIVDSPTDVRIELAGRILRGIASLSRRPDSPGTSWSFQFKPSGDG